MASTSPGLGPRHQCPRPRSQATHWAGMGCAGWSGLGWVGLICVGFHVVSCRGVLVCGVDGAAAIDDVCMAVLASTNR